MQIYYCSECRSRLSSVDVEAGRGTVVQDRVYCDTCMRKLDLQPAPSKEPVGKTHSTRAYAASRGSERAIPAGTAVTRVRPLQTPARSSSAGLIALMLLIVAALIVTIVILIARSKSKQEGSRVPVPAVVKDDSGIPGTPGPEPAAPAEWNPDVPAAVRDLPEGFQPLVRGDIDLAFSQQGLWHQTENSLLGRTGDASRLNLETYRVFADFTCLVSFMVEHEGEVRIGFRRTDRGGGEIKIDACRPDAWHSFELTLSGTDVRAVLDGAAVPAGGKAGISLATGSMDPAEGKLLFQYTPRGKSPARLAIARFAVKPEYTYVWLEAENADELTLPMTAIPDPEASGGRCVMSAEGSGMDGGGQAVYSFDLPRSGTYTIWARCSTPDGQSDSFYLTVDNGERYEWWAGVTAWRWGRVTGGADAKSRVSLNLKPGRHTLIVDQREDGARLDKLLVTDDQAFKPEGMGGDAAHRAAAPAVVKPAEIPPPTPAVQPAPSGPVTWGEPVELDPAGRPGEWDMMGGNSRPAREGEWITCRSGGLDMLYKPMNADTFRLEFELDFRDAVDGNDWFAAGFPYTKVGRGQKRQFQVNFHADSTLRIRYDDRDMVKRMNLWPAGKPFRVAITVQGPDVNVAINGKPGLKARGSEYPFPGGFQFFYNGKSTFALRGIRLFLPAAAPESSGAAPAGSARRTIALQQGRDGYAGCLDMGLSQKDATQFKRHPDRMDVEFNEFQNSQCVLIRFDLQDRLPPGVRIESARLHLWCFRVSNNGPIGVSMLQGAWNRDTDYSTARQIPAVLQGNTAFPKGHLPGRRDDNTVDPPYESVFDVTEAVRVWAGKPEANSGLLLAPAGSANPLRVDVRFHSAQAASAAFRPRLEIVYFE